MKRQSIPQWFANQNVFVTGGTGFMGKILVEKLLRSCPLIGNVFLLVRAKRGKTPQQRLEAYINQPIFDMVRASDPNIFRKLHAMAGDTTAPNLGLTHDDAQMLRDRATIVFHVAACVRFDQSLQQAVEINVKGTWHLLELAKQLRQLRVFVHVSTSYCHCGERLVEERVYRAAHPPLKIVEMLEWMGDDVVECVTPKLLGDSPNTYAYTKCLTEELVADYAQLMPTVIARPSIVTPVWKEPIAGWVDNLNGAVGLLVGAGKGIVRTMHCDPKLPADMIPVDVVINQIIVAAWEKAHAQEEQSSAALVVNVTTDTTNPVTWDEIVEINRKHFSKYPFSICMWYPGGAIQSNYLLHVMCIFLFHTIPAYVVDFLLRLFGQKPFLVRTQQRISNGLKMLQYYTTREWEFDHARIPKIAAQLGEHDRQVFYTDMSRLDYDQYLLSCLLGARKYTIGEDISTVAQARKTLYKLYVLDRIVHCSLIGLLLWMSYAFLMHIIV